MAHHHVLLLGGHGKVAQHLTPLLLQRSWTVTSVIRNPDQVAAVKKLGENQNGGGKLHVLVRSLEEIKSQDQARAVINETKPDYVVWSAGAGGKGGAERTFAIDRDAAIHFINAAAATPTITRFLMVSYNSSRRSRPAWWSDASWEQAQHVNNNVLASYYQAKVAADEELYRAAKRRPNDFAAIGLRPGALTDEPAGRVELGKTKEARGQVSRESVARVADLLLASEGVKTAWLDLLDGDEDLGEAVNRVIREGVDAAEGEPFF